MKGEVTDTYMIILLRTLEIHDEELITKKPIPPSRLSLELVFTLLLY